MTKNEYPRWKFTPDGSPRPVWAKVTWRVISKVALTVSSVGFGFLVRVPNSSIPGQLKFWLMAAAVILFLVAVAYEVISSDVRDKEKAHLKARLSDMKLDGARQFANHVNGLLTEQVDVSDGGWSAQDAKKYIRAVVTTTAAMVEVAKSRACLFEYDTAAFESNKRTDANEDPENAALRPLEFGNSIRTSSRILDNRTEHGKAALNLVQTQGSVLVENIHDSPNFAVADDIEGYETFIAVCVHWQGKELGMLTVDAPESGQLTEHHKELVMLLARWVAVALYHREAHDREAQYVGNTLKHSVVDSFFDGFPEDVADNATDGNNNSTPPWQ